jgi:hypothetical protein
MEKKHLPGAGAGVGGLEWAVGAGFDGEGARVRHGEELVCRAAQLGRVELVHAHHGVAPVLLGEGQPVAPPHEGEEEAALLLRVRVRVDPNPNPNPNPIP